MVASCLGVWGGGCSPFYQAGIFKCALNLDTLNSALEESYTVAATVSMTHLRRALEEPRLLPEGWSVEHSGGYHWDVKRPDGKQYTVTTELASYEYVPDYVEWFGPGSPAFPPD